ncbi:MAG: chemotaxis protein CheX [Syntrophales bacterium]
MDVRLINPFLLGAKDVLSTMAYVETDIGKPYVKRDERATGDVSGIIGLTGDAIGSLAISFSEACICGIAGSMLGETFTHANQEVFDAVGEITNMISGASRTYLEKESLTVWAGIPSVVFGKDHHVKHILQSPSIVIPFSTKYGSFFVDVCIKATVKRAAHAPQQTAQKPGKFALDGKVTPVPVVTAAEEAMPEMPSAAVPEAAQELTPDERIELLKKQLEETKAVKESLENLLRDKPFMNFQMRQKYKSAIPLYDKKIKRIKMDIAAVEVLKALPASVDSPVELPRHYQNYPVKKPPQQRN